MTNGLSGARGDAPRRGENQQDFAMQRSECEDYARADQVRALAL